MAPKASAAVRSRAGARRGRGGGQARGGGVTWVAVEDLGLERMDLEGMGSLWLERRPGRWVMARKTDRDPAERLSPAGISGMPQSLPPSVHLGKFDGAGVECGEWGVGESAGPPHGGSTAAPAPGG